MVLLILRKCDFLNRENLLSVKEDPMKRITLYLEGKPVVVHVLENHVLEQQEKELINLSILKKTRFCNNKLLKVLSN
jgi:hypothetical protein